MAQIRITPEGSKLTMTSPYHPDFPARARKLGGRWDGGRKLWVFDARDLERVKELCRDTFGTNGIDLDVATVTLMVTFNKSSYTNDMACFVAGRQVARVYDQDGGVALGRGVIIINGGFSSAGSRKNPTLAVAAGTVIEVRDVPAGAKLEADLGGEVELLDPVAVDREAIELERARLVNRLAEIDTLLGG